MNKKLVIFDMDGTLIDSSIVIANAINHVRNKLYLPPLESRAILEKVNDPSINPARFFYNQDKFEPEHTTWFNQYYTANHKTDLSLYAGVLGILDMLKAKGSLMALATNAYRVSALESIENLGISSYFDVVVCVDDVEEGKPSPDMLHLALKQTGCSIDESIFVGDGPRDQLAAESIGMDYVMVDWGFTKHDSETKIIGNTDELLALLDDVTEMRG